MNGTQYPTETPIAPAPLLDWAGISILEAEGSLMEIPKVRAQVGADRFHKTLLQLKRLVKVAAHHGSLQKVLLRTSGGSDLTLTRTDLSVTASLAVRMDEPAAAGVVVLAVPDLERALKTVGRDQTLSLELGADQDFIDMDDGDSLHRIPATNPGDFPPVEHAPATVEGLETDKLQLGRRLSQVMPFVATASDRANLETVLLEWGGIAAPRLVGTDGWRLAVCDMPAASCAAAGVEQYLLPHRPLTVIQKMLQQERGAGVLRLQPFGDRVDGPLGNVDPAGSPRMTLAWEAGPHLPWSGVEITVERVTATYPDYHQIVPGPDYTETLSLSRDILARAATKAAAYTAGMTGITLHWDQGAGELVVRGRNRDSQAEVSTAVPCTYTGEHAEGSYSLNGQYLCEALKVGGRGHRPLVPDRGGGL